jgi:hypothetical protein
MTLAAPVLAELSILRTQGQLNPRSVVARAKRPSSALHGCFEWDDAKAADAHRLATAERLIFRAKVTIVPVEQRPQRVHAICHPTPLPPPQPRPTRPQPPAPVEPFPSPPPPQRGPALPEQDPLREALEELESWRYRHRHQPELARVMHEIDRLLLLSRLRAAVAYARRLEQDGYDRQLASERAAAAYGQARTQVLELLRAG